MQLSNAATTLLYTDPNATTDLVIEQVVLKAITSLKLKKAQDFKDLCTESLKHAFQSVVLHLTKLINAVINNQFAPSDFCNARLSMIGIKKKRSNSANKLKMNLHSW